MIDVGSAHGPSALCPQVLFRGLGVHLKDMCPRKSGRQNLSDFVTLSDRRLVSQVQDILCEAQPEWLDQAEENFMSNLDFFKPIRVKTGSFNGSSTLPKPSRSNQNQLQPMNPPADPLRTQTSEF